MNLIEAYRYLAALAQHRHFGRAATACHITQPALSNALRALEAHLGVAIVRRSRQFEGLTPEGERVLATAHRLLREQEALRQALAGTAEQPRGRLLIAAVPTAVPVAARFAARLLALHPGLQPQVRSLASQEIETGLDTLAVDLGLGYAERSSRTDCWPQYLEHYYLLSYAPAPDPASAARAAAMPARSQAKRAAKPGAAAARPAAGGLHPPLGWADAAQRPLALLSPEMHNRVLIDAQFQRLGLRVQPVLETNSVSALLAAVQTGAVCAVLPGAVVATVLPPAGQPAGQGGWQARPLDGPALRTPIAFMAAAGARRSQALEAALRLAADAAWLDEVARHSGQFDAVDAGQAVGKGAAEA
ncbi:LysR substrate-binding domain-containing protein [Aquabacterium sp. OR-4]|uniref:LysR substrate-binding domain-containing protein n=1 Tax=Aquabacterium sp. OR-4 TaxID=2978127 RepID=UPI0021B34BF1|nr:LysR substrate-binding domain-containing protein [Aquabacterium sp. OR-4]MDT7838531.1 LysR substrate-binding domain-containing protein [Aquabacterium sp. OR-4]